MHRNAFILRTSIFGRDPLAFLTRSIPGLSRTRDAGRRDEIAVRKAELQIYVDWTSGHASHIGYALSTDGVVVALHCSHASNGAEPSRQDRPRLLSARLFGSAAL